MIPKITLETFDKEGSNKIQSVLNLYSTQNLVKEQNKSRNESNTQSLSNIR